MNKVYWDTPESEWRAGFRENSDAPATPQERTGQDETLWDVDPATCLDLKQRMTARFSRLRTEDRIRLGRLIRTVIDDRVRTTMAAETEIDRRIALSRSVFESIVSQIDKRLTRDEDQRLKRAIKAGLSLEIERQMIDSLTLNKPMNALKLNNSDDYHCLCLKYYWDYTYQEISIMKKLSVSQIRTHIERAKNFLKKQLG